jgi:HK97 gp10 family phage protein
VAGFSIQIEGLTEFIERMRDAPELIKTQGAELLQEVADGIAEDAKSAAPVNYGNLKNQIQVLPLSEGGTSIGVEARADYSAYVEFGTGTHVEVDNDPEGLPEYALQFKGGKEIPGMIARPYFFPAVRKWAQILKTKTIEILNKL